MSRANSTGRVADGGSEATSGAAPRARASAEVKNKITEEKIRQRLTAGRLDFVSHPQTNTHRVIRAGEFDRTHSAAIQFGIVKANETASDLERSQSTALPSS